MCIKFSILKSNNNSFDTIKVFNDNQLDIAIKYFNDYQVRELLHGEDKNKYYLYYESKNRRIIINEKIDKELELRRIKI